MYGLYGKLTAQTGKRAEFVAIMARAAAIVGERPDCHLYIVNEDLEDETCIWIYEVWDSETAHDLALQDERVRALIAEAVPLMQGRPEGSALRVVGGHGLKP